MGHENEWIDVVLGLGWFPGGEEKHARSMAARSTGSSLAGSLAADVVTDPNSQGLIPYGNDKTSDKSIAVSRPRLSQWQSPWLQRATEEKHS